MADRYCHLADIVVAGAPLLARDAGGQQIPLSRFWHTIQQTTAELKAHLSPNYSNLEAYDFWYISYPIPSYGNTVRSATPEISAVTVASSVGHADLMLKCTSSTVYDIYQDQEKLISDKTWAEALQSDGITIDAAAFVGTPQENDIWLFGGYRVDPFVAQLCATMAVLRIFQPMLLRGTTKESSEVLRDMYRDIYGPNGALTALRSGEIELDHRKLNSIPLTFDWKTIDINRYGEDKSKTDTHTITYTSPR